MFSKGDAMFSQEDIHVTGYTGGAPDKKFKHLWTMTNKAKTVEGEKIYNMRSIQRVVVGGALCGCMWQIKMGRSRWL